MKAAQSLLAEFKKGDLRALSRLISLAENKDSSVVASLIRAPRSDRAGGCHWHYWASGRGEEHSHQRVRTIFP